MAHEIVNTMATMIDVGTVKATASLKELRLEVRASTQAWQANEAHLKSVGEYTKATAQRVQGLKMTYKEQQQVIAKLREEQARLDTTTTKGAEAYAKYDQRIASAGRKLASMEAQTKRAELAQQRQVSGLNQVRHQLSQTNQLTHSYVETLKAQGNTVTAQVTKLNGLRENHRLYTQALAKEKTLLTETGQKFGVNSNEYDKQKVKVSETTAALAKNTAALKANERQYGGLTIRTAQFGDRLEKMGAKARRAGNLITQSGHAMISSTLAIGGAFGYGVNQAVKLENKYRNIHNLAITGGEKQAEVTVNVAKQQRDGARLAIKYGKSQQDIANGYLELTKRGYTTQQSLGAMQSLLQASVASGDDFNDVVHDATATLESFGLRTNSVSGMVKNTKSVVNKMAYAADMTATGFKDMGLAMTYTGATAHGAGISLSETAAAIGELSNRGVEADKAGTGLRKVINSLISPSKSGVGALQDLGLKVSDFATKSGKLKPLSEVFKLLGTHMRGMTSMDKNDIFHALFGTTGQQAGLILSQSYTGLKNLTKATAEAQNQSKGGYVARLAAKNMKSSQNQLNKLKQSVTVLATGLGATLLPALNDVVKPISTFATKLSGASESTKKHVAIVAGMVAAYAPLAIAVGSVTKFVGSLSKLWKGLNFIGRIAGIKRQTVAQAEYNTQLRETVALETAGGGSAGVGVVRSVKGIKGTARAAETGGRFTRLAGKFKGISKVGRLAAGSVGALDVVMAGTELIGTNKHNMGHNVGGAVGTLGGTAAGAAIGTAILPGIGTAIGAGLGGMIGTGIGHKLGTAIQKGLNHHPVSPKVKVKKAVSELTKFAEKTDKKGVSNAQKQEKAYQTNLKLLLKYGAITKAEYKKQLANHKAFESKQTRYSQANAKQRAVIAKYYNQEQSALTKRWDAKILHDKAKYGLNSVQVTRDEANKVKALNRLKLRTVQSTSYKEAAAYVTVSGKLKKASHDEADVLKKLTDRKKHYSKKQLESLLVSSHKATRAIISDAGKQYEATTKRARAQREKIVKAAQETYKGSSKYAKAKRHAVIAEAIEQENKADKHAKSQLDKVTAHARKEQRDSIKAAQAKNKQVTMQSALERDKTKENAQKQAANTQHLWDMQKVMTANGWHSIAMIINLGIAAINGIVKLFGHKGNLLQPMREKYAQGTSRNPITRPTLATLNDGHDSPETNNRELAVLPNGTGFVPHESNWTGILPAKTEVFTASETKALLANHRHFANGTGFFNGIGKAISNGFDAVKKFAGSFMQRIKMVTRFVSDPLGSLKSVFSNKLDFSKLSGDIMQGLAKTAKSGIVGQASKWWSTVWSMINGAINANSGGASDFLDKAIKVSKGHKYVWGATGANTFDCSGLIMYVANKFFGKHLPHFTGSQYAALPHISEGQAKAGDLVYFGSGKSANQHVGIVAGHNRMWSAQSPNAHPNIGYSAIHGFGEHISGFARIPGLSTKTKNHNQGNGLQKFVRNQLGKGMFAWIAKHLAPLMDFGSGGGTFSIGMIKQAAEAMHVHPSESFIKTLRTVINTESGGQNIMQHIHDINSGGNEARGILQFTPPTFRNYAVKGHHNIMNPYDQLLAFFNNSDWRHSIGRNQYNHKIDWMGSGPTGHRRMANGGIVNHHQMIEVAEGNQAEAVIPLSQMKRSRGWQLVGEVANHFLQDEHINSRRHEDSINKKLLKKIDSLVELTGTMVKILANQHLTIGDREVYDAGQRAKKRKGFIKNIERGGF